MNNKKVVYVTFGNKKIEQEFEKLKEGKFQDKQLYEFMDRAMKDIKNNPSCGTKIPKKLWPRVYIEKYNILNLWKYDLPNSWRLIYTIKEDDIQVIGVILEWFDHKNYERRFKY